MAEEKLCEDCGKSYHSNSLYSLYCSGTCKARAWRKRKIQSGSGSSKSVGVTTKTFQSGNCIRCGKEFLTKSTRRKYCSYTCAHYFWINGKSETTIARFDCVCSYCKKEFKARSPKKTWCSRACLKRKDEKETNGYNRYWRSAIKLSYGINTEDYFRLLNEQQGVCAICKQNETAVANGKIRKLGVDHDHSTGKVRGLLCQNCNIMIGGARDNPGILTAAVLYLKSYK